MQIFHINKKFAILLTLLCLCVLLISSISPTAIDSWNLINSAKSNSQADSYESFQGVGIALELLFRGVNSDLEFEIRYVLIAIASSLSLVILSRHILIKYFECNTFTAFVIALMTYVMGPFQMGGIYWDSFYVTPLLGLILVLKLLGDETRGSIYSFYLAVAAGGLAAFLILGKQNSATLPMLFVLGLGLITLNLSLFRLSAIAASACITLLIVSYITNIVNWEMLKYHFLFTFRHADAITEGSFGLFFRIISRLFPFFSVYMTNITSPFFYLYGVFQTTLLTIVILNLIVPVKVFIDNLLYGDLLGRSFIPISLVGVGFIHVVSLGRNWNELYTLGPIVSYLMIRRLREQRLNIYLSRYFLVITTSFFLMCAVIPVKNLYHLYSGEYHRPYGAIILGSNATGSYMSPRDMTKLMKSAPCVGGIGNSIAPLLYLGVDYCSNYVQIDQSIRAWRPAYPEIVNKMKLQNRALFINSCFDSESCLLMRAYLDFKISDFVGTGRLIYSSGNKDIYLSDE